LASTSTRRLPSDRLPQPQKTSVPSEILKEEIFLRMISLERKRSERTQRPFVLLLMDTGRNLPTEKNGRLLLEILSALQAATRETDVMGWYESNAVVGVMFTEITPDNNLILSTILSRISEVLRDRLTLEHAAAEADIEDEQNKRLLVGNTEILQKVAALEQRILELEKSILSAIEGRGGTS